MILLNKIKTSCFTLQNDGATNIQVLVEDETIWTTQAGMAEIFDIDKSGISRHLKNIFDTES